MPSEIASSKTIFRSPSGRYAVVTPLASPTWCCLQRQRLARIAGTAGSSNLVFPISALAAADKRPVAGAGVSPEGLCAPTSGRPCLAWVPEEARKRMGWRDWFRSKAPPEPISDPDLGVLEWRAEDGGWTGVKNGLKFTLGDEDDAERSESLRRWALETLSDPAYLDRSLSEAIDQAPPYLRRYEDEMRQLRYAHLYFSENAKGRSIFAALTPEPEYRCWRLEFDGERCLGIGFDT